MKIELEKYNLEWVSSFEKEKVFLKDKMGRWLSGSIEHVGSTSVAGMLAKPIVDIMFGVKDLESSKGAIQVLSDNGYCYYPYKAEVMHWFCKPTPDHRTHHLHLIPYKSELWMQRIRFRDILRHNQNIAKEYSLLKQELVKNLTERHIPKVSGPLSSACYRPTANQALHRTANAKHLCAGRCAPIFAQRCLALSAGERGVRHLTNFGVQLRHWSPPWKQR